MHEVEVAILREGVPTTMNSELEDDGSTRLWPENTLLLDALLGADADGEWFGAEDYLPAKFQVLVNYHCLIFNLINYS